MSLYRHRRFRPPGLPEVLACIVLGFMLVSSILWMHGAHRQVQEESARGFSEAHPAMEHGRANVSVSYENRQVGEMESGWMEVSWPRGMNVLPLGATVRLPGATVQPDGLYGVRSGSPGLPRQMILTGMLLVSIGVAAYYCFRVYPAWRQVY